MIVSKMSKIGTAETIRNEYVKVIKSEVFHKPSSTKCKIGHTPFEPPFSVMYVGRTSRDHTAFV